MAVVIPTSALFLQISYLCTEVSFVKTFVATDGGFGCLSILVTSALQLIIDNDCITFDNGRDGFSNLLSSGGSF